MSTGHLVTAVHNYVVQDDRTRKVSESEREREKERGGRGQ